MRKGGQSSVADVVSAPSRNVLEQVRDFYGLALPDAEVIPGPTRPVPATERWKLEDCDPVQVLFIGRFDRHKGGDLIIEAFGRVLKVVPEARLASRDRTGAASPTTAGNGTSRTSSATESPVLLKRVGLNGWAMQPLPYPGAGGTPPPGDGDRHLLSV